MTDSPYEHNLDISPRTADVSGESANPVWFESKRLADENYREAESYLDVGKVREAKKYFLRAQDQYEDVQVLGRDCSDTLNNIKERLEKLKAAEESKKKSKKHRKHSSNSTSSAPKQTSPSALLKRHAKKPKSSDVPTASTTDNTGFPYHKQIPIKTTNTKVNANTT